MGFGLLLCAYFLLTFMSVGISDYVFLTYLLGAMVTLFAVGKLKDYNPRFNYLYPSALLYALLAIYSLLTVIADIALWEEGINFLSSPVISGIVDWTRFVAELSYAIVALWSAAEIARSVGLEKHQARSWRNMIFVGIWAVGQVLLLTIPALANAGDQALVKILILYQLVVYLFNTIQFYTCYSGICPQGEEFGRPTRPSRFRFINEMNRRLDAKDEEARAEYERQMAERGSRHSARNNHRHHRKKK